jgi:ketosteroid isomerase-like protein
MSTNTTISSYFEALKADREWRQHLADDMVFTNYASPSRRLEGRAAYIDATRNFFAMITGVEVLELLVEDNRACARTRYSLQVPAGPSFTSDVAEFFTVRDGKIDSLSIYFDSAPYPG